MRLARAATPAAPVPDQGQAASAPAPRPRKQAGPVAATPPPARQASAAPAIGEAIGSAEAGLHYNVRLPPSADLQYEVSDGAGQSRLVVDTGDTDYRIRFSGVPAPAAGGGARIDIDSTGGSNDTGFAPLTASVAGAALAFDQENGRLTLADGKAVAFGGNLLDPASLLLHLAGMGLADPEQFQDRIHIAVAGTHGTGVISFEVVGLEQVDGPMGSHQAWHLAQVARSGEVRLEVWLAPARHWYPVQLKTTAPDGTVVWQKLASAAFAATPQP